MLKYFLFILVKKIYVRYYNKIVKNQFKLICRHLTWYMISLG